MLYDWLRVLHILAFISWMAALLYLPRLMVYHVDAAIGSDRSETLKVMEYRLLRYIATPAMLVTWLAGLTLAWHGQWFTSGWFHGKLLLVLALSAAHMVFAAHVKAFAADRNVRTSRFFRIWNEVPTLLMVGIVILVIIKPF